MAVTADVVKVVLEGEVDGYNADIKSSVGVFEGSMTKMERAAVKAERATTKSMDGVARATVSAVRSIAQGQSPVEALGQLGRSATQALGGTEAAVSRLAPLAFSAAGALTGIGIALVGVVIAADRVDASNKVIINSLTGLGRSAGLTIDQFKAIADASNEAGNVSRAAAEEMARSYINTGKIGGDVLGALISITDDYSRAVGVDAKKATELLGAAFADPVKGAELLQQQFGFLDAKTMTLIQTMVAAGDTMGAQKILSDRLAGALAGQADNVSFLTKAWRGLKNVIADAGTAARDFFDDGGAGNGRTGGAAGAAARAAARQAEAQGVADSTARNKRGTEAQGLIDGALGDDRRRAIRGEIQKIEKAVKDGSVDAAKASAAIKTLKEDMAKIGAGPSVRTGRAGRQPTRAETRESAARADGRFAAGASVDRGVQSIDVQTIKDLEKVFVSRGGLEEYIKGGGGDFQAAGGPALQKASDDLKNYQDDVYNSTYDSIRGGLEAGFRGGLPGVLEYLAQSIQTSLLDSLAKTMTDAITASKGGSSGGGTFGGGGTAGGILSIASSLFGRANGGNMVGGRAYHINEGRPEVFVPPMSGKMVPLGRGGGSTTINPTINMKVDLTGANGDATIVRIARQAAIQAGKQAYAQAVRDAPAAVAKRQGERG